MQITIEIPDELADRAAAARERLGEIVVRGLCREASETSGLAREVITFLARSPRPEEILAFRASEKASGRVRELLDRNRDGVLSPDEEAEMDEIEALDNFLAALKARARRRTPVAA